MKRIIQFCLLLTISTAVAGQDPYADSLRNLLNHGRQDTLQVLNMLSFSTSYRYTYPDSAIAYATKAIELSDKLNYQTGVAIGNWCLGVCYQTKGDYAKSLSYGFQALNQLTSQSNQAGVAVQTAEIGLVYRDLGEYEKALYYSQAGYKMLDDLKSFPHNWWVDSAGKQLLLAAWQTNLANIYAYSQPDSSLYYLKNLRSYIGMSDYLGYVFGLVQFKLGHTDSALYFYRSGLNAENRIKLDSAKIYVGLADLFRKKNETDSCIFYAKIALSMSQEIPYPKGAYEASLILANILADRRPNESVNYFRLHLNLRDSLFSQQKSGEAINYAYKAQLEEQEAVEKIKQAETQYRNKINVAALAAAIVILSGISLALWRRTVFKQKAMLLLQKEKEKTEQQKSLAEKALAELKSTQAQLIQSEKMASLGELTAGIAHEIQNPLNFVNNFSEVNKELIEELKIKNEKLNIEDGEVRDLVNDIKDNSDKINLHGKRAQGIVSAMLQHTSSGKGEKQLTDINKLTDEYLRLAYHGFRSREKEFNCDLQTSFDEAVKPVNVIPQEIGRVILNLVNNAFYAVNERQKAGPHPLKGGKQYGPAVTISTKRINTPSGDGGIIIIVKDNGNGIPEKIKEKIFQPFFTTKPTGSGTGLGLSLSYDIVKAHGGEIKMETKEGEGTTFIILLPVSL